MIDSRFWHKLPKAFLIMVALCVLSEMYFFANRSQMADDFWNKFLINEETLLDIDRDFDFLVLGNSIQKTGIDPNRVSPDLLNLGLASGKPMEHYLLMKRYLSKHKPPKALFYYFNPIYEADQFKLTLKYFVTFDEYLEILPDLSWDERRHFFNKFWASLDAHQMWVSQDERLRYPGSDSDFKKAIIANRGFLPAITAHLRIHEDHFSDYTWREKEGIIVSQRDMKYFFKLYALLNQSGTRLVLLATPHPRQRYEIYERTGFNKQFKDFVAMLSEKLPGVYAEDEPVFSVDHSLYGDGMHFNAAGQIMYTDRFRDKVFLPFVQKHLMAQEPGSGGS